MAVRVAIPDPLAVQIINAGADQIVEISDEDTAAAMRLLYRTTHNVAEPAGAIALAALAQQRDQYRGGRVAVVLTGGNVDANVFADVLIGCREAPGVPMSRQGDVGAGNARSPRR